MEWYEVFNFLSKYSWSVQSDCFITGEGFHFCCEPTLSVGKIIIIIIITVIITVIIIITTIIVIIIIHHHSRDVIHFMAYVSMNHIF